MLKKIIITVIIIGIIGFVVGAFLTRKPSAPSTDVGNATENLTASSSEALYRISTSTSKVSFAIGEILNGKPFTAVGVTSEIAGDIVVSTSTINIGTLAINAKTFKTDSVNRDGAIARFILKSEKPENEFIYFKPTAPVALGTSTATTTNFTVNGDLTVSGVTKPAVFEVSASITEENLSGRAILKMKRSDYSLVIPQVSFVASVDDEFTVTTDIVAPRVK